jgi:hypothetical protein
MASNPGTQLRSPEGTLDSSVPPGAANPSSTDTYKSFESLGIPPPGEPQKPIDNVAQPPAAPQRRPRSRNVTPQDGRPARAAATGQEPKYLGGKPITTYVDCVAAQRNGQQPPRGYGQSTVWKLTEHEAIAKLRRQTATLPPPWRR